MQTIGMEETIISLDNFDLICRTCLCNIKNIDSHDLYETLIEQNRISDLLMKWASIQIDKQDNLPKRLCQQCHMNLINCQEFFNKCKKSEETLRNILIKSEEQITIKMEEIEVPLEEETIAEDTLEVSDFPQKQQPTNDKIVHTDAGKMSHVCNICSKRFLQKRYLLDHKKRMHIGEKPFVCDVCSKCFTRIRHLQSHKKHMHPDEKPHVCNICSKCFSRKRYLLVHRRRVHTGEKPHVCDICSKRFSEKYLLRDHMNVHTNEKPYICDVCSKGFSAKHILVSHMTTHTDARPYVCHICSKDFKQQRYLIGHMFSHTGQKPYVCDICSKGFPYKSGLKYHMLSHTGVRSYVCGSCCKGFPDNNRIHSDEKTITCKECKTTPKNDLDELSDSAEESDDKMEECSEISVTKVDLELTDAETEFFCSDCGECFNSQSNLESHIVSHNEEKPIKCNDCDEIFTNQLELQMHTVTHADL